MSIDRDKNGGPPHGELNGEKNRPTLADSERTASSANTQGDTEEDTEVRAGVEPGKSD